MLVFADDPDENVPNQMREFPELKGFNGVGFFSVHFPKPLFVSYQDFYDNLEKTVLNFIEDKNIDYKNQSKMYLSMIKSRYRLK